jgi:D-erythro-7,8-dihydroneopterin triphosphate epimerase
MAAVIRISELLARCVLGVSDEERREKQDVLIDIEFVADVSAAVAADEFSLTVDYRALKKRVLAFVEQSEFRLLESLTDAVALLCVEHPLVEQATVRIQKPSALRFARSVGAEVTKRRGM